MARRRAESWGLQAGGHVVEPLASALKTQESRCVPEARDQSNFSLAKDGSGIPESFRLPKTTSNQQVIQVTSQPCVNVHSCQCPTYEHTISGPQTSTTAARSKQKEFKRMQKENKNPFCHADILRELGKETIFMDQVQNRNVLETVMEQE